MKKAIIFILFGIFFCRYAYSGVINHELRPQFHIWKSSALQGGTYTNVLISSSPIIFHMISGSGTVNNGGDSAFTLFTSTGAVFQTDAATRAFVPLDSSSGYQNKLGVTFDVLCTTNSFFNKTGGALIQYYWDYLDNGVKYNRYPND